MLYRIPKERLDRLRREFRDFVERKAVQPFSWERRDRDSAPDLDRCMPFSSVLSGLKYQSYFNNEDLEFFNALGVRLSPCSEK